MKLESELKALRTSVEPVPIRRSRHQAVFRTVAAAACLLLTIGLSVGVWSGKQTIETKPPHETTVTTITQTETAAQSTRMIPSTTGNAGMPSLQQKTTYTETCITPLHAEPAATFPHTSTDLRAIRRQQGNHAAICAGRNPVRRSSRQDLKKQLDYYAL